MKLICSAALLSFGIEFFSNQAQAFARDIILIENQASLEEGQLLKKILNKNFRLPLELITIKNINQDCENKTDAIVHLCLLKNGELEIKKINHYVVKNSLSVFADDGEIK